MNAGAVEKPNSPGPVGVGAAQGNLATDVTDSGWGGFPILILIALATALAWLFGNPFFGFVVVLASGLALLATVEFVRRHRKPHA